jgi:hypothetical protein
MGDSGKPICGTCVKTVDGVSLACKYCFLNYHPACKKIVGSNIKKHINNYLCSDGCQTNYDRIINQREQQGDGGGSGNNDLQELKNFMTLKFSALQTSLDAALSENKQLGEKVEVLSRKCVSLEKTVENLKYEADGVNREAVRNNITIMGVPSNLATDPKSTFVKLCELIAHPVVEADVRKFKSYNNKVTKATTIVVEFANSKAKRDFLDKKKAKGNITVSKLTGVAESSSRPRLIFIRDELTRRGMKLYSELRDVKKLVKIKYCWTRDGDVFARIDDSSKFIRVRSSFDINEIANAAEPISQDDEGN